MFDMYIIVVRTNVGSGEMIDYHYEPRKDLAIRTAKRLKGKVYLEEDLLPDEKKIKKKL